MGAGLSRLKRRELKPIDTKKAKRERERTRTNRTMPTMIAVVVRDGADADVNAEVKSSGSSALVAAGTSANTSCGDAERDRDIDTSAMRTCRATSCGHRQQADTQATRIAASAEDDDERRRRRGTCSTIARREDARLAERGGASASAVSSNEDATSSAVEKIVGSEDTKLHKNDTTKTNDGDSTANTCNNGTADSEADSAVAKRPAGAVEGGASRSATKTAAKKKRVHVSREDGTKTGINTGRWTSAEHDLFVRGVGLYGRGGKASKKIAALVKTRTKTQVHTHMQKWWARMERSEQGVMLEEEMLRACSYRNETEIRSTAAAPSAPAAPAAGGGKGETNIGQSSIDADQAGERAKSASSRSGKQQSREDEEVVAASVLLGFNTTVAAAAAAAAGTASSRTPSLSNDCVTAREAASKAAAAAAPAGEGEGRDTTSDLAAAVASSAITTRTVSERAAAPSLPPEPVPSRQPHALPPPHAGQRPRNVKSPEDYQEYQEYVANNGISHPHHQYQHHQQQQHLQSSLYSYYQAQAQAQVPTALPHVTASVYHHHHLAAPVLPSEVAAADPSSVAVLQAELSAVKKQVDQLRAENQHIRKKFKTVPAVPAPASGTAPATSQNSATYGSYHYPIGAYAYGNCGSNGSSNDTRRHCAVHGCRRQSRGSSHSYMCRRHFLQCNHYHQLQQYHHQQRQRDQHDLQYYGVATPTTVAGSSGAGSPYNVRRDAVSADDTTENYAYYRYAAEPNASINTANDVRPVTASSEEDIIPPVDREVFHKARSRSTTTTAAAAAAAANETTAKKTGSRGSKRQAKDSTPSGKKADKRKSGASKSSKAAATAAKRRKTNPVKKEKTDGLPECITHGVRGYRVQPQLGGRSFYVGNVDTLEEAIAFRDMVVKLYDDIVMRLNISRTLSNEEQKTIVRNAKVVAMAKIWPGHHVSWMDKGTKEGIDAAKNKRKKEGEAAKGEAAS